MTEGYLEVNSANVQPSPADFGPMAALQLIAVIVFSLFGSYCAVYGFQLLVLKKK